MKMTMHLKKYFTFTVVRHAAKHFKSGAVLLDNRDITGFISGNYLANTQYLPGTKQNIIQLDTCPLCTVYYYTQGCIMY